jgi:hypothetical protein
MAPSTYYAGRGLNETPIHFKRSIVTVIRNNNHPGYSMMRKEITDRLADAFFIVVGRVDKRQSQTEHNR